MAIRTLTVLALLCAASPALAQETATPASPAGEGEARFSLHAQLTYQLQGHGAFDAPYSGPNSFESRKEIRGSYTTTFFLGARPWRGGELYVDPELIAGSGVSRVLGLAAPPNGETYRVDSPQLKVNLGRLFLRQTWDLGGAREAVADDQNQVAGSRARRRVVLTAGKLSGTDIFDLNAYAHDARTQFNNWSLWANAAWDYPADTRGYTWGLAVEWVRDAWALRLGSFLEPQEANGLFFDHHVRQAHGDVLEIEHDHRLGGRPGAVRFLAFRNRARMGSYAEALAASPVLPDITATRQPGRTKYGFGLNAEQELTADLGAFARLGWNDGRTEAWAFTEVERTASVGLALAGRAWRRPLDHCGLALGENGLGPEHRLYLAAGGLGFMLGDGRLRYGAEHVADAFYAVALAPHLTISVEIERYANPGFNRDRGPLTVYGARLHLED